MIEVMVAVGVNPHPHADTLTVYQFGKDKSDPHPITVVANKTNSYVIGDTVAVARLGTILEDGTEIKKAKLRGIESFGMAMGVVLAPVGSNVTSIFGASEKPLKRDGSDGLVEETDWPVYPSIDGFLKPSVQSAILDEQTVLVTEKIHGSSVRYGIHRGEFVMGTHGSRIAPTHHDPEMWPVGHLVWKMTKWAKDNKIEDTLRGYMNENPHFETVGIYGEIYGQGCSDLTYGEDTFNVRFFYDLYYVTKSNPRGNWASTLDCITAYADMGLSLVECLYYGPPKPVILKTYRDKISTTSQTPQISEGIVIRSTGENPIRAKYKSPLYEERASLRNATSEEIPKYINAYDLLTDMTTAERIRHVLAKAEASGMEIRQKNMKAFVGLLLADIRKESLGEWPSEVVDEKLLLKWLQGISGQLMAELIGKWNP